MYSVKDIFIGSNYRFSETQMSTEIKNAIGFSIGHDVEDVILAALSSSSSS